MPAVETTGGPVDVEELGLTLIHEHFRTTDEAGRFQFPHLYDEEAEWDAALADANAVRAHGVRTVVDPGAMFLTRDAVFNGRVAKESGLQVVMATGVYTYDHLPQFLMSRDEDAIAAIFVHEIEHGIQGTGVKPALIKCAADVPGVTPNVEKIHRAAARASKQTGRPIMAHSHPGSGTGLEQMRIFADEGVDPGTVQIAHTGDTDDLDYIERLLDTGCLIGLDRYGLDLYLPTEARNATTLALLERGYAGRMFLSQDYCSTIDWFPREVQAHLKASEVPDWSMTFLFDSVIPELKERGMSDDDLNQMMVQNPKRWLGS
ncbi:MAG: phosphotriesterase-related protein [Thermoleophilaceae bacterium]|nr:phosphotriesterase-related protein [Thermoleophilaceae bacterium]